MPIKDKEYTVVYSPIASFPNDAKITANQMRILLSSGEIPIGTILLDNFGGRYKVVCPEPARDELELVEMSWREWVETRTDQLDNVDNAE